MWAAAVLAVVGLAERKPPDFNVLSRRVAATQNDESTITCLLMDSMVPRQRIDLQFGPPVSGMIGELRESGGRLGVLGMDQRTGKILRHGVEARIEHCSAFLASQGYYSSHTTRRANGFTARDVTLVSGRRFEVLDPADDEQWPPDSPFFTARVRWLTCEKGTAASILRAEEIAPLVTEWISLVRETKRERAEGQLDQLLGDLGGTPDAEDAEDLAFWVAALVNPLPALGVSREIRPKVLESEDALKRVEWAHAALTDSIARMKKLPEGPIEVEPPPKGRS